MAEIRTAPLYTTPLQVSGMQAIGAMPNRVIAAGTGRRPPGGPGYDGFEVR
ncbi:MAG TPA: hypothetical protein VND19_05125 [Acetobacteraceae bacterium]|nr:hypothetical protein [Acetobacteraceae bacterium]